MPRNDKTSVFTGVLFCAARSLGRRFVVSRCHRLTPNVASSATRPLPLFISIVVAGSRVLAPNRFTVIAIIGFLGRLRCDDSLGEWCVGLALQLRGMNDRGETRNLIPKKSDQRSGSGFVE